MKLKTYGKKWYRIFPAVVIWQNSVTCSAVVRCRSKGQWSREKSCVTWRDLKGRRPRILVNDWPCIVSGNTIGTGKTVYYQNNFHNLLPNSLVDLSFNLTWVTISSHFPLTSVNRLEDLGDSGERKERQAKLKQMKGIYIFLFLLFVLNCLLI